MKHLVEHGNGYVDDYAVEVPANPEPFEIVTFQKGKPAGASTVILIEKDGRDIGDAASMMNVPNVSNLVTCYQGRANTQIKQGDKLRISTCLVRYHAMIFVNGFGWLGIEPDKPDKRKVTDAFNAVVVYTNEIVVTDTYRRYDQLCLRRTE